MIVNVKKEKKKHLFLHSVTCLLIKNSIENILISYQYPKLLHKTVPVISLTFLPQILPSYVPTCVCMVPLYLLLPSICDVEFTKIKSPIRPFFKKSTRLCSYIR